MARPNKPSALKKAEGNPGKRALNSLEPTPEYLDDLAPPAHLPESAKVIWNELAPPLRRTKLLTEVDRDTLAITCIALSQHRYASQKVDEYIKLADADPSQQTKLQAWLITQSMSYKQAMKGLTEFGCSPRARTAIQLQAQTDMFKDIPQSKSDGIGKYLN